MGLLSKEKDIKGQKHILAYITPGEADTLQDLGAEEVLTSGGIPAYPPLGQPGTSPGTRSDYEPGQGHRETYGGPPGITTAPIHVPTPSQPTDYSQEYGGVPPTTTEFISDTGYSDYELERGVTYYQSNQLKH